MKNFRKETFMDQSKETRSDKYRGVKFFLDISIWVHETITMKQCLILFDSNQFVLLQYHILTHFESYCM